MKRLLFLLILCTMSAFGQGFRYNDTVPPASAPVTVSVCPSTATGTPCTPTSAIYNDAALTQITQNPYTANSGQPVSFYIASGNYFVQFVSGGSVIASHNFSVGVPSTANVSPNLGAFYLARSCGTQTNCFQTPANTEVVTDATFTSGSPNVATSTNDPAFVAGDVGKRAQASYNCSGPASNPEKCGNNPGCPDTTILTVTDAHHVVLAANCLQNSTGGGTSNRFAWGNPDDTAIAAAVAALGAQAFGTIYLPCTGMWVEEPAFILTTPSPGTLTRGPMGVVGCPGGTLIVPGFNFNFAGCPLDQGCIFYSNNTSDNNQFSYAGQDFLQDVNIQGLGISCFSGCSVGTNQIGAISILANQVAQNVTIGGWNWQNTHFDAVLCNGGQLQNMFVNAGGFNGVRVGLGVFPGCNIIGRNFFNDGDGAAGLLAGGTTSSLQSQFFNDGNDGCAGNNDGLVVQSGAILQSHEDSFTTLCVTGKAWVTDSTAFGNNGAISILTGGSLYLKGTTQSGTFPNIFTQAGSKIFDLGGNVPGGPQGTDITAGTLFGSGSITGTTQTTGNVALTSGWGTSTVSAASGNSQREQFTITLGGTVGASPVVTVTFPTPFWVAPLCSLTDVGGTGALPTSIVNGAISTTTAAFTINGTFTTGTEIFQLECSN